MANNIKGRMRIRRETESSLPGNPLNPAPSRPNRLTRLWEIESKPDTTVARLEAAYLSAFDVVDKLGDHRSAAEKSGKFTPEGLRDAVLQAALESTASIKAGRNTIAKARDEAAELRKKVSLPKPDPADMVGFLRRQEIRNRLAAMSDKDRGAFIGKYANSNPDVGMAILELPAEFSGVFASDRELLLEQTLEAEHGPALTELREIEQAIEVAESAVEAAYEEVRVEAGVFDVQKWDEMAAPYKAKAPVPWLFRFGQDIKVKMKVQEEPERWSSRNATPEEVEAGRYFNDFDEYQAANAA